MNKCIFNIGIAIALLCAACGEEEATGNQLSEVASEESLLLCYRADANQLSSTRAAGEVTTDPWRSWNESKVTKLAVFVVAGDGKEGKIKGRVSIAVPSVNVDAGTEKTLSVANNELGFLSDTKYAVGDTIYLMANYLGYDVGMEHAPQTAAELKKVHTVEVSTGAATFQGPYGKQEQLLMYGKYVLKAEDIQGKSANVGPIRLRRRAAKLCIGVKYDADTELTNPLELQSKPSCRLAHYTTSTLLIGGTPEAVAYNKEVETKYLVGEKPHLIDEKMLYANKWLVFYSYPNDWFDYRRLKQESADSWSIEGYSVEAPIEREREMYVMLYAPYPKDSDKCYYYKIPVNRTFYEHHDQATFTAAEVNTIKGLYIARSNHIYEVTATINSKGGDNENGALQLPVTIKNLTSGGDFNYGYE